MGLFFLLALVFPVVGLILYGFGFLGGRLQKRTAVSIRSKGRISIMYVPMIWIGLALLVGSIAKSDWEGFGNASLFIVGMIVFQACWAFAEFGIIQGHRKYHNPDSDIPSVYEEELRSVWVKILMPGRWLVLRLLKKRICLQ